MLFWPALKVTRFGQLKPGDLFVWMRSPGHFVGLKIDGPAPSDKPRALLLSGPEVPLSVPFVCGLHDEKVLLLPENCILQLSTDGADWHADVPDTREACILLAGDKAYIRANCSGIRDWFEPCWVALADGALQPGRPEELGAITTKWRIVLPSESREARVIVAFGEGAEA